MPAHPLRRRQIHLDFHTSAAIPGVASAFDPERFADTLAEAHVDSVTCFARCHHGHIYYPSTKFADLVHPHLQRPNLLGEQIEACHARGIRVPIYVTVQWDYLQSRKHREWIMVKQDGSDMGGQPMQPGFYHLLDVFHPGYRQFLFDMVADLADNVPAVDGLFFDITQTHFSYASHWLDAMKRAKLDVDNPADRSRFARKVTDDWKLEMTHFVRGLRNCGDESTTIFYNAGHIGPSDRSANDAFTHFELESLPSGGWGYMHFPCAARYARSLGKPILGMTGKFHTSWGDFGSLKNLPALLFECQQMIAHHAVCSIGDQLHPTGELDPATYRLIGRVYDSVEQLEPWWTDATPLAEVALITPEGQTQEAGSHVAQSAKMPDHIAAANRMLQELGIQFDIVAAGDDLSSYPLVIVPEQVRLAGRLLERLTDHAEAGGALILIAPEATDEVRDWLERELGVKAHGPADVVPEFVRLGGTFADDLDSSAYVMYQRGVQLEAVHDAEVLAFSEPAYFERTFEHFCSHKHAPSTGRPGNAAVVASPGGRAITFAHPLCSIHFERAPRWCKSMLEAAVSRLLPKRLVTHTGPSSLLCVLTKQTESERRILHLLHYIPERRGTGFDVIEDVIPLHDVELTVAADNVTSVRLVPSGDALAFEAAGEAVRFTVPRIEGQAVVEIV